MRYIIKVSLLHVASPNVWREMAIPAEITFHELHLMIQAGMGWRNEHLYAFKETEEPSFMQVVSPYTEEFGMDASKISAKMVLWSMWDQFYEAGKPRNKIHYEYDFGDAWEHGIEVLDFDHGKSMAVEVLDGQGACPPENCGGAPGYERIKEYLSGRISPKEYYDWFTAVDVEGFDPQHFDVKRQSWQARRWRMMGW